MTIVKLRNGNLWIHSPIPLEPYPNLKDALAKLGPVKYIIAPNKCHWLYALKFAKHYPEAKFYAPNGLKEKIKE